MLWLYEFSNFRAVMDGVGVVGIESREVAAMRALQYPQRYSIRGYCSRGGGGG